MTTFTIDFDFNSADQNKVLSALQQGNYNLIGFKGAMGPSQIAAGVPAWFVVPFGNMFGQTQIQYEPQYKVYIFNSAQIAAQTTITMQSLSNPMGLSSAVTFTSTGQFATGGVDGVPADSIGVLNDRPASTPAVTVGLAGLVTTPTGQQYLPFCAFTLPPQNSIIMKPLEQVLLVAAQLNLTSGNVQANLSAPGCKFAFDATNQDYPLIIKPGTFEITGAPGKAPTIPVGSGSSVALINQPL
ncbi:hypothetical protein [Aurantimonas sp. VKM B-3413]|uniref:hypothetical protein n=1 Tax=Aurantimonas sp. VKM B-3413 TaxID=2779401 RepID=UPI001E571788|nr:hypothetical protein [Aurantimonas sp. VKM B-3413]MCB8836509.1 hypothetical protein [Aurantimonas sp. VKM B-3413]